MPFLGAHESVAGGLHLAFARIAKVGGEALQIFTRNQRQWSSSPLADEEISLFREAWHVLPCMPVISHASYLINLASSKDELFAKSVRALVAELQRCELLGIRQVVLHPGSHGGKGCDYAIERIAAGLDAVFSQARSETQVLIETVAGQGTSIGASFSELGAILAASRSAARLGVCFDTCHVFAAGYDLRDQGGYEAAMDEFAQQVGLGKIALFHLNDSAKALGSRVDRHAHIGRGEIGAAGFRHLLNDQRFASLPMILETPKNDDLAEDLENLALLRSFLVKD